MNETERLRQTHQQKMRNLASMIFELFSQLAVPLPTALEALVFVLAATTTDAGVALGPVVRALHQARVQTDRTRKGGGAPVVVAP